MSFTSSETTERLTLLKNQHVDREKKLITLLELLKEDAIEIDDAKMYLREWGILKKQLNDSEKKILLDNALQNPENLIVQSTQEYQELNLSQEQIFLLGTPSDKYILNRNNSRVRLYFDNLSVISKSSLDYLKQKISIAEVEQLLINNEPCLLEFHLNMGDNAYFEFREIAGLYEWDKILIDNPKVSFVLRRRN